MQTVSPKWHPYYRPTPCWRNFTGKVKYASICIARFTAQPQMRSDMDHTVLPADYTMPAFTPQPQNMTALWLVLILPSHGG